MAQVLIGSLLVLMYVSMIIRFFYLILIESKNGEDPKISYFFQKIYHYSFKKASIFHYTYSDYACQVYENHKPSHLLK
jgi:hypothetical protein